MPELENELLCWEVWLTVRNDRDRQQKTFVQHAEILGIEVSKRYIKFRDRTVLLIRATRSQIEQSIELLNNIAELRKAKTTADFFRELSNEEQKEWLDDLLPRINNKNIDDSTPTASHGELSPYSTTSLIWDREWPYKPDIVMEGGNTANNKYGQVQVDSLSLLSTNQNISKKIFTTINATSAASALASKICAHIMTAYPALRPETIRALVIHSAVWTPAMLKQFGCDKIDNKTRDIIKLVRICGFGVPNLMRALSSFYNDFTIIIEDTIQPYKYERTEKNRDMKFYDLPYTEAETKQERQTVTTAELAALLNLSVPSIKKLRQDGVIEPLPNNGNRKAGNKWLPLQCTCKVIRNYQKMVDSRGSKETEEMKKARERQMIAVGFRAFWKGARG